MPQLVILDAFVDYICRDLEICCNKIFYVLASTSSRYIKIDPLCLGLLNVIEKSFPEFSNRNENQTCKRICMKLQVSILFRWNVIGHKAFPTRYIRKLKSFEDIRAQNTVANLMRQAKPIAVKAMVVDELVHTNFR